MDTKLGSFPLTAKQIDKTSDLKTDVILGFSHRSKDNIVTVVSNRELTQNEISDLKKSLKALPDDYSKATKDYRREKAARKNSVLKKLGITANDALGLVEVMRDGNND